MLRELVYDAEDILTDCLLRAEYRKEGFQCCSNFTPRELIFQYRTGKKLKDINERIKKMQKILTAYFKTIGQQSIHDDRGSMGKRWTSPVYDESAMVGLIEDTEKIIGWILPENRMLHQVGIVGMGGLGKTTVSQKIFDSKQVVDRFEKRIWVSISQIVRLEGQNVCWIWALRKESVAIDMGVEKARIHQPRILNEEESYALFCKIAFSSNEEAKQHPELEEVGKVIVKKCHGLPLAVKTIGGLLKSKAQSTEVWRRICHNFHDALTTKESENSVMASLQLSYDELPIRMKQCLLCFSLYPEDSEIGAEQLVHWWVGEGFIEGRNTSTTMELPFDYLSELISRCLVEVVQRRGYDGRAYSCRMHDLVRDLTIKIAREEGFCCFDDQGRQRPSARSRRLSFTNEADLRSMNKKSRIRAVLMMTSSPIQFNRNIAMFTIKSPRVLDFSKNKLENICIEDLLNWISSLERLASLNLSGVSALKELPFSIGKLRNLQLLVLSGCNNLQK
ncbi:disease resistance RPP13-like protein 4 [Populus alba x Populus x berolinensis]|uniref:Disease resistance RPP13-like protein 4 n=1 Tax=Populus alba x Populus x berolinensis TaxID=444605 RepID=A0AAD6Q5S6_9ROSI|nr:disease resistance RPP13-like protein 4 [Populus alba x Populus x berolinensis]